MADGNIYQVVSREETCEPSPIAPQFDTEGIICKTPTRRSRGRISFSEFSSTSRVECDTAEGEIGTYFSFYDHTLKEGSGVEASTKHGFRIAHIFGFMITHSKRRWRRGQNKTWVPISVYFRFMITQ